MRSSFKLTRIFGIDIKIHITFFLLLGLFFFAMGLRGLMLVVGVFFFVTVHELAHSLMARHFGIKVAKITLLPIGGVASMPKMPTKPHKELLISLAGPASNILIVMLFYFPMRMLLGSEVLMYPFQVFLGQTAYEGVGSINLLAHIYWINFILAVFNMLPAFPMDGGRVLRALLSFRLNRKDATRIAVRMGHIFALLFGFFGIAYGHILLVVIAVFIYMAASSEGMQVSFSESMRGFTVSDVLDRDFMSVKPEDSLGKVLELMLHRHQENIPVISGNRYRGLLTRREIIEGMHSYSKDVSCDRLMRTDLPVIDSNTGINSAQRMLQEKSSPALAVNDGENIVGVVTAEDINRLFVMVNAREGNSGW